MTEKGEFYPRLAACSEDFDICNRNSEYIVRNIIRLELDLMKTLQNKLRRRSDNSNQHEHI